MDTRQLAQQLAAEGCNPANYLIGKPWAVTDVYCLTQIEGVWHVYFTERGKDEPPILESPDEAAACAFYFDLIMGIRHDHCVGFFREETAVHILQARLNQHNIPSYYDIIPAGITDHAPRYRVFVIGKAIFAAKALLEEVPMRD